MKIVHIAAEIAPFAKVGGLGDVVEGLCKAFSNFNQDISVIVPFYKSISNFYSDKFEFSTSFEIFYKKKIKIDVFFIKKDRVKIYFLKPKNSYFSRKNIYGYKDDILRFLLFSKAAFAFLKISDINPSIINVHDWHTAIIPLLLKEKPFKHKCRTVLTINNLNYQGRARKGILENFDIDEKYFKIIKDPNPKRKTIFNLLKAGIIYCDRIVCVSKTYAKEVLTKKLGAGLEKTLKQHKNKLFGIVNGIDENIWNPKTDQSLFKNYSKTNSIDLILKNKKINKEKLSKKLKLKFSKKPLICSIGRLVEQKNPKLISFAIKNSEKLNYQIILLGCADTKKIKKQFNKLNNHFKHNENVSLNFDFSSHLSHQIFAASDFIIIPSILEPCGLTQLIALSYGTIPIVRQTGGLTDTVFDIDSSNVKKNGFVFLKNSEKEFEKTLKKAMSFYYNDFATLKKLIKKNISKNYSWNTGAKEYLNLYKTILR